MTNTKPPSLFIISTSVDSEAGTAIRDYISIRGKMKTCNEPGMEGSEGLEVVETGNRFLREGLARATHVLGLIAQENPEPWWLKQLPELAKSCDVEPAILTLKGMAETPDVPRGVEVLRGIRSLNEYLFRVSPDVDQIIFNNPEYGGLMAHTTPHHPLDAYLDWDN